MASPVEGVLELGARAPLSLTDALLAFVVHAPHAALPSPPDSSGYGFRDGTLPNNSAPSLPEISPPRRLSRRIAAPTPPASRGSTSAPSHWLAPPGVGGGWGLAEGQLSLGLSSGGNRGGRCQSGGGSFGAILGRYAPPRGVAVAQREGRRGVVVQRALSQALICEVGG